MSINNLVYSSEKVDNIPIIYSKRADAPVRGDVFTAKAIFLRDKNNLTINRIQNHTGYVKKNYENTNLKVEAGKYYRFKIVYGPYQQNSYNYYYAIPLREIKPDENHDLNKLSAQDHILIQRLGEFLLGIRFNRDKTISSLKEDQRNWDWFYNNFM
jgi:hypothetical protein